MLATVSTSILDPYIHFYGQFSTTVHLDDGIMASLLCWLCNVPSKCHRCWWILLFDRDDLPSMAEHTKWKSRVWHKWQFILGQVLLLGQKDPNLPDQGFWLDSSSLLDMGRLRVHVHWSHAGYTASQKACKAMAGNPQWSINQLFCEKRCHVSWTWWCVLLFKDAEFGFEWNWDNQSHRMGLDYAARSLEVNLQGYNSRCHC